MSIASWVHSGWPRLASSKSRRIISSVASVSPLRACGRPPNIGGCQGYWTIPGGIALADSERLTQSEGMRMGISVN